MKYGLLINRRNLNLGDDIQSYAESLFLPRVDYLVDREYINNFKTNTESEKVAVIMGAWWSFRKWNFPPSKQILPLCVSMHVTDYTVADGGTPVYDEFLQGAGGDYLRHFSPVGSRDMSTLALFEKNNIPAYFSGCVTLTLPKQKKTVDNGKYILLVDVSEEVRKKVSQDIEGSGLEIRQTSNIRKSRRSDVEMDSWEFRKSEAIDLLTLYQNAKCVITSRLHVALPCLAMDVPVLCLFDKNNSRFSPYNNMLHMANPSEYLSGKYEYNLLNPIENKKEHLKYRHSLTDVMKGFVDRVEDNEKSFDTDVKYSIDPSQWRVDLMESTLDRWVYDSQIIAGDLTRARAKYENLEQKKIKLEEENIKLRNLNTEINSKYLNIIKSRYYRYYKKTGRLLRKTKLIK